MRKLAIVLMLCLFFKQPIIAEEAIDLAPNASSYYLMDYQTGTVMAQKNAEEKYYPASMTKMMSLLLVMEQIHAGYLDWSEKVVASENAAKMGGSQIYLEQGEIMSVEDLVKSSALASANDAIVALAEKVGGTEANFVTMMNNKASELGCINTHFTNPTGLHDENHYSCAKDMAKIAQALINEGQEDILQFTSKYEDYIREESENKFWLVNTNKLLRTYSGMDGLKTGYTSQSLYCITVTAQRERLRLIAVVMNEPTKDKRNQDAKALLDYGFANYHVVEDMEKGSTILEIATEKGKPETVEYILKEPLEHLEKKNEQVTITNTSYTITTCKAPIAMNDVVGQYLVEYSNGQKKSIPLTVKEPVEILSFTEIVHQLIEMTLFA